jgi:hypothetical protein
MSCLGFWVAWSVHYNKLLEQLFPTVLSDFPLAQRQAEFNRLRAHLFFSRNLSPTFPEDVQSSINPLDTPTSIARLRLIPWDGSRSNVQSGFQPDPSSNVTSARGATVRFSFSGVLEYLDDKSFINLMEPWLLKVFRRAGVFKRASGSYRGACASRVFFHGRRVGPGDRHRRTVTEQFSGCRTPALHHRWGEGVPVF